MSPNELIAEGYEILKLAHRRTLCVCDALHSLVRLRMTSWSEGKITMYLVKFSYEHSYITDMTQLHFSIFK